MEFRSRPIHTRRHGTFTEVAAALMFMWCATALAQNTTDGQHGVDPERYRHIVTSEPRLTNRPLRQDNISDEEVREVQRAALEVYPDFIVLISGVTDGCDCEEGSKCTAQVWLALNRGNQVRSLVLSKIDGHWKVGAVQSWRLKFDEHQARFPGFGRSAQRDAWDEVNQRLLASFPTCPVAQVQWTLVRGEGNSSRYVDMSSMQVSGNIRRVNFKSVNPPPIPPSPPRPTYFPWVKFVIFLEAFDCKDRRQRMDEMDFYYSDGTVTKNSGEDPLLWNLIRPGVGSTDLDLVCGWTGK